MIFLRSHQTLTLQCRQSAHPLVMDSSGCPREQNTLVTVMQGGFPRSTGKQEVPVASFLPSAQGPPSCGQTSPQVSWWSVSRHARRPHCCLAFLPVSGHPRVPRTRSCAHVTALSLWNPHWTWMFRCVLGKLWQRLETVFTRHFNRVCSWRTMSLCLFKNKGISSVPFRRHWRGKFKTPPIQRM